MSVPYFTTEGNTYQAQMGNSVTIVCQVENLGKFIFEIQMKYQHFLRTEDLHISDNQSTICRM